MKKILLSAAVVLMIFSCQNDSTDTASLTTNAILHRGCASQEVLEAQMVADPTLAIRMNEIEAFTQKIQLSNNRLAADGVHIIIPVVVNVLYRTAAENISDAQIQTQIDVLNKDFTKSNSEFNSGSTAYFGEFLPVAANVDITFELKSIVRKSTTKTSWGTRDAMKSSKQGGINPTSPSNTLNIWACTIGGGILGYAQFPGGKASTDGVVIDSFYFGLSSAASYPYNLGRTASHEVGHWMNLRHIWGDSSCGNDLVSDTPVHKTANYGAPTNAQVSLCLPTHNEMTMNFMDYTDDRGMYMFTDGQKARMAALFFAGGIRSGFRN